MKLMNNWMTAMVLGAASLLADQTTEVQFTNCSEYVGTGTIPLANAAPFVPSSFQIAGAQGGTAMLVARVSNCAGVSVEGSRPEPGTVAHIGITVVSPDGSGDINNYTVAYVTTSRKLAQKLSRGGLPVEVDEDLVYEIVAGKLFADVSPEDGPGFYFHGPVADPAPNTGFPFLANWWYKSHRGVMKMATSIPTIAFGQCSMTIYSRKNSPLGKLIGGNSYSAFTGYNARGLFATGRMVVKVD